MSATDETTGPTDEALLAPRSFLALAEHLEARGYEAWAVGGAIRDRLLGIARGDWDLATDARPEEVRALFPRTIPLGIEHGTVGVLQEDGTVYEVTTFRRDIETDGRHAVVAFAESIEEDLARRDFTINAIAWRIATHELKDPWNGREDLEARILRAVGEPAERFAEDYLRVLRGLRFAGRFDLTFDPPTREALEAAVHGTTDLSAERVREELEKIFTGPRPSAALRLYRDTGVLGIWYPELDARADTDAWDAALDAIDELHEGRPLLRLARLLMIIPGAGEDPDPGEAAVAKVVERLKLSNADRRRILELRRHFLPFVNPLDSSAHIREWLSEVGRGGERDLFRLHFAAARASGDEQAAGALVHTWRRVHEERLGDAPIDRSELAVDGEDILGLGVAQGPVVGLLLDELHAQVLEDPTLNEREALLGIARELIEMASLEDV
ncbi:MAG TPA: CCA tRNA nucleotidyltransferase [Gemmatimonadota bacterium]|nr:CCA tRNA nucleotidyltransferase [Gemmatimonadota bacterium]